MQREGYTVARKYRFPGRAGYEMALCKAEQALTLHRIALDALLRGEFTLTERHYAGFPHGDAVAWFEMGIARADQAHGGLLLIRSYYPTNGKPSQEVRWADSGIRDMSEGMHHRGSTYGDPEAAAYWNCFLAVRQLYHDATRPARPAEEGGAA